MPINRIERLTQSDKERIAILAKEITSDDPSGEDAPIIFMEEVSPTRTIRLYAVWSDWKYLKKEDRSRLLLAAFAECEHEKSLQVSIAMGLTPVEEARMRILPRYNKSAKDFEDKEVKEIVGEPRAVQVRLYQENDSEWWVVTVPKDSFKEGDAVPFKYREYALSYARGLLG